MQPQQLLPANLLASKVYAHNTLQASAADITFAKGVINFNGCGAGVQLDKIVDVTKKVYAAGTLQDTKVEFSGVTVVDFTKYTLTLLRKDTNQMITWSVITGASSSPTSLASQFDAAVGNDLNAFVTSARTGTFIHLVEKSVDSQGFLVTAPTGSVLTASVAHVDPSGTVQEVQQYNAAITTGTFRKYDFTVDRETPGLGGQKQITEAHITIWADESDTNFAAFEAALFGTSNATGILTGGSLDNTSTATLRTTAEPYVAKA